MDIIIIFVSIVLIIMSLLLLAVSPAAGVIGIAIGIFCFLYGRKQRKAKQAQSVQSARVSTAQPAPMKVRFNGPVVGLSYRKENIKSLLAENDEYKRPNDQNSRVYKYEYYRGPAQLVPEPTNKYDANAVMVVVEGIHIGYIPSERCLQVKKIIKSGYSASIEIYGGPFKEFDFESGKWHAETKDFSATLNIF